ncbi:DnaA ATPase domain-containing protein [Gemmatimonadota bacterium]
MADLDPRFTFENFVVGPANRLAAAAARRAAESPGASYNPLFLYSASGLGKTHILGAISNHVEKIHPDKNVVYQTLEGFLGELTEALEDGTNDGVKDRYEKMEILLMDDVQFLAGQSEAQEMLLRTLDTLTGEGKQVVLASDRPPAEIDGLDARLRSRFEGGLLVDIGPPEYETRVAITRKQAEARGQDLDPAVAEIIGRISFKNVRELGGALNRILAIQELEERAVTPEEAGGLLGEEGKTADAGDFLDEISGTVAAQVERQEAPWRKLLRETVEAAESEDFKADRLRRLLEKESAPGDAGGVAKEFDGIIQRLKDIKRELDEVGNPWPEAAHGVLRDPERLEEAEALLASARERARPFPTIGPGPDLHGLGGKLPQLVIRAAEQLINTDRPEYNPLYVWSPDGDAARSLLAACGRNFMVEHEGAHVAFISVADFAQEFIGSLSGGVAGAWRERWWSAELLLVLKKVSKNFLEDSFTPAESNRFDAPG